MKTLITSLLLGVALVAQIPQEPTPRPDEAYPGQSQHAAPPPGWFCWPANDSAHLKDDAHACECRGMAEHPQCTVQTEDECGNQMEVPVGESSKCRVWCHKDHCTCARLCKDS